MNNQDAIRHLFIKGLINRDLFTTLIKRAEKLNAKHAKEVRQECVNDAVERHLESLTPGYLFKHRSVWEAVGVESFTRSEVITSLPVHRENFLVEQVRKGDNNYQVFWNVTTVTEVEV